MRLVSEEHPAERLLDVVDRTDLDLITHLERTTDHERTTRDVARPMIRRGSVIVRSAVALVIGFGFIAAIPSTASAHGGGPDATNYETVVTDSADPGLDWRVRGGDAGLELTNRTGSTVVVLGYEDEPYLRFDADGSVWENSRSPATWLNASRFGAEVPDTADAAAAPQWRQVSDSGSYTWHDHRAHWMSTAMPVVVTDPDRSTLVQTWVIPLVIGDGDASVRVVAAGELWWRPSVAWWPPVAGCLAVVAGVLAVVAARRDGRAWSDVLARPVAAVVWLVMAANVVRVADDIAASDATLAQDIFLVTVSGLAIAAVSGLAVAVWRRRRLWFGAALAAGVLTLLLFGGEATDQLWKPLLVTELPEWVRRWTIAASFTVIAPAVVAAVLGGRELARNLDGFPADATATGDVEGPASRATTE